MNNLKVIETEINTILKDGRKTYATISFNENPDYNWILWMKGGWALSGFKTKQDAINRANELNSGWKETINRLITNQ